MKDVEMIYRDDIGDHEGKKMLIDKINELTTAVNTLNGEISVLRYNDEVLRSLLP